MPPYVARIGEATLIEHNLVEDLGAKASFYTKSSNNVIARNTITGPGAILTIRTGEHNEIRNNWVSGSTGILVHDTGNRVIGNSLSLWPLSIIAMTIYSLPQFAAGYVAGRLSRRVRA
jgi:hypothetical protein